MWSLSAPLGKPNRYSSILSNYWKCATHRHSSQSTGGKAGRRRWTAEEDLKLRSLIQQGLTPKQIASEFDYRTSPSVENRARKAMSGAVFMVEDLKRQHHRWTADEEALLLEKRQQGLSLIDVKSYFPHRSYWAIIRRAPRLATWPILRRGRDAFTKKDVQRIIEMRLEEAKPYTAIAAEMQCTAKTIENVWHFRCIKLISEEAARSVQLQNRWTPSEEERLLELQRQGTMSVGEAALQFPSKSVSKVWNKINTMRLRFPKARKRSSPVSEVDAATATSDGRFESFKPEGEGV